MSFHRFHNALSLKTFSAVAVLAIAATGIASAQSVSRPDATAAAAQSASLIQTPALDNSSAQLFSSSSSSDQQVAPTTEASVTAPVNFANYMQYGGGQRRRYGRPTYRGSNTTADGTPKYTFEAGVGFVQPVGNTWHYFTPSYGFQVGGGRNFDRHLGVLLQFDYDHMGLTGQTLANQSYLYFQTTNASNNGLDASNHIWSFTLNPVYTLVGGGSGGFGAYLVGGVGFYHKVTTFTVPQQQQYCDFYYGCGLYTVNGTFDHYSSNAPGVNGGFGVTYKFSRFSNERFFGEVRYVVVLDSQRQGLTIQNATTFGATYTGYNYFPANSNRTTYFPVKFGIRF